MDERVKKVLSIGGIAAAGIVVVMVAVKGRTAGATDSTGAAVNTSQPLIIPSGGGSTAPDNSAAIAQLSDGLNTLADNQQTLADGMAAQNKTLSDTISVGQTSLANLINARANTQTVPAAATQPVLEAPTSNIHTFLGASVDVAGAQQTFGLGSNYKYVDTSGMTLAQQRTALQTAVNPEIVGGEKAGGGISAEAASGLGIVRVAGEDRAATLAALQKIRF